MRGFTVTALRDHLTALIASGKVEPTAEVLICEVRGLVTHTRPVRSVVRVGLRTDLVILNSDEDD